MTPTLCCKQAARRRNLDLATAAADAEYWWETGFVPLRPTPLRAAKPSPAQPPLTSSCGKCGARVKLRAESAGKRVRCPKCREVFEAPPQAIPASPVCPSCHKSLPPEAKICVDCGFDLRTGKKLQTMIEKNTDRAAENEEDSPAAADTYRFLADDVGESAILCVCRHCGVRCVLGVNSVVVTREEALKRLAMLRGGALLAISASSTPDSIKLKYGESSWPDGNPIPSAVQATGVPAAVIEARKQNRRRSWKCEQCRTEQEYDWSAQTYDWSARDTTYREADNLGTRQDTLGKAETYWLARQCKPEKEPYLLYHFPTEQAAREALLELPCIHVANDTKKLICTEALTFGSYAADGCHEAILAGWDLTADLFEKARVSFRQHGGKPRGQGELAPAPSPKANVRPASRAKSKVQFVRKYTQPNRLGTLCTYEIYRASDKQEAQDFLKSKPVPAPLHYLVVETPEGNWGRDKDGIYRE